MGKTAVEHQKYVIERLKDLEVGSGKIICDVDTFIELIDGIRSMGNFLAYRTAMLLQFLKNSAEKYAKSMMQYFLQSRLLNICDVEQKLMHL